jgi:hypothetical protein
VLGLVVVRGFGEFDQLIEAILGTTKVQADSRHSGMVRRFDLLDAIADRSSRPVIACQPSRGAAAEENQNNTDESDHRAVKSVSISQAVGTALHNADCSTSVVSRRRDVSEAQDRPIQGSDGKVVIELGCRKVPFLARSMVREDASPAWAICKAYWTSHARNEREGWQNVESRAGRLGKACDRTEVPVDAVVAV